MAFIFVRDPLEQLLELVAATITITVVLIYYDWRRVPHSRPAIVSAPVDIEKGTIIHGDKKQRTRSQWNPPQEITHPTWLKNLIKDADADLRPLSDALVELKEIIENDSVLYMLFSLMFQEVPRKPPYNKDPTGSKQIQDYHHMLRVFNHAMTRGPPWMYSTPGQRGLVGFPFSAVLDWPMATVSSSLSSLVLSPYKDCSSSSLQVHRLMMLNFSTA